MDVIHSLDIMLYYTSMEAGTWTMQVLEMGQGVIGVDELEPEGFYNASGGIRIKKDHLYCFLDDSSADDLVSYIRFLFSSLIQLRNKEIPKELRTFMPDDKSLLAQIYHGDGSVIRLTRQLPFLTIDYLDSNGNAPDRRGSPYFQDIQIASEAWTEASFVALREYFIVAQQRIMTKTSNSFPHLSQLIKDWERLQRFWERKTGE